MKSRAVVLVLLVGAIAAGAFAFSRNLKQPDTGRSTNVADAPAGGRTQATSDSLAGGSASGSPVDEIGDPLLPGVPESPDVPSNPAHKGLKKIGERIREVVLADGTIGDDELPGISLAGLSPGQRRWFVDRAVGITCSCGCGQDLLECRRDDLSCPLSPGLVDSLTAVAKKRPA